MIGFKTIPQGDRVLVWDRSGNARLVDGPTRVTLFGQRVQPIERHAAGPEDFLIVEYKDGRKEHHRGPTALWLNPVSMEKIHVASMMKLDANEAIVVYRPAGASVQRRIERGPALFMPAPDEWLHHFSWHGADPKDRRRKLPSALQFDKLRVIPDQMYFDVECVRTADDALLTVKLMIFFGLEEIERMLDQTHDPIGDFINAATADVIDFAATETFERFKEKTESLSLLDTYPQLLKRAETIGYRITKVVYRGYQASQTLQAMHDDAIETRTKLRLESETEQQAQDLADMKQKRGAEREKDREAMEEARALHQTKLSTLAAEAALRQEAAAKEQALKFARATAVQELEMSTQTREAELADQQASHREQLAFLGGIAALKVDVTRYLVAQYQHPDKVVRIDGAPTAQLHLHEQGA
jgi:hypothetical protein